MKISEMMNYISDDSVNINEVEVVSSDVIKEATMKKIENSNKRKNRKTKHTIKVAVAVAAVSMIGTMGVYAATSLNGNFFEGIFGNQGKTNVETHTEYQDQGDKGIIPYQMPAREYVDVDIEKVEKELGSYVMNKPIVKKIQGHTVTFLSAVRDEDCMMMEFTIEKKGGTNALQYNELTNMAKGAIWNEKTFGLMMADAGDCIYVDLEKSTDEIIYCYDYIVFDKIIEEGKSVNIEILDYTLDSENATIVGSIEIPVTKCVPRTSYVSDKGGEMEVSSIGISINMAKGLELAGCEGKPESISTVSINYKDGTVYKIFDEKTNNSGYVLNWGDEFNFTYNRYVDVNDIDSIEVNGIKYHVK